MAKRVTATNVLWYYPNIIGYLRFIFMVLSFVYAESDWKMSITFYCLAFVGDVVDGYVARAFKQCKVSRTVLVVVV
jgi:CDP-diacylglycerol--inositol 3-phosphatidyltransferase